MWPTTKALGLKKRSEGICAFTAAGYPGNPLCPDERVSKIALIVLSNNP